MANETMTLISRTTVTTPVASIVLSSIPSTYTDLVVKLSVRGSNTQGGGGYFYYIYPNGSSSNITGRWLVGNGSSASSSSGSITYDFMPANDYTTNTFSANEIYFPNYAGSTYKSYSLDSLTENNATGSFLQMEAGLWSITSAITSLTFTPSGGNFDTNSTVSLYGIKKGSGGATVS